ncbi:hypothetical protein ACIOGW_36935 [Streptomyces anulatus]
MCFTKKGTPTSRSALDCYFGEHGELAYIHIDGCFDPQVTYEGIRLIGHVPSHFAQEMESHADEHGTDLRFSPTGDYFCDGFQLELGAQRVGAQVVSWALFFVRWCT